LVFIPLHDTNPLKSIRFQYATVGLIALNVAIFVLFQSGWIFPVDDEKAAAFAVIPAELLAHGTPLVHQVIVPDGAIPMPERFTLITYMFLHGGWLHLIGNMLFLWVFGDNVEDAMGHLRFIMFYLICGIGAAVVHVAAAPNSDLPLIGASGAVAGIIAAYLMLHPKVKVWVLALWRIPIKIQAYWALGFWIIFQFANLLVATDDNVAWWAHIGGLATGALLILFMRRRGVPLFDRTPGGA
jgi:membrane associated rhomboid family serine protease